MIKEQNAKSPSTVKATGTFVFYSSMEKKRHGGTRFLHRDFYHHQLALVKLAISSSQKIGNSFNFREVLAMENRHFLLVLEDKWNKHFCLLHVPGVLIPELDQAFVFIGAGGGVEKCSSDSHNQPVQQ
jgi:hypothetical protein